MIFDKMYGVMDNACQKASKTMDINIRFPKPGKHAFSLSAVVNGSVGIGFLLFGCLSTHKWALLPGALGVFGSLLILNGRSIKKNE